MKVNVVVALTFKGFFLIFRRRLKFRAFEGCRLLSGNIKI